MFVVKMTFSLSCLLAGRMGASTSSRDVGSVSLEVPCWSYNKENSGR